jgi:hypothetical protein
MFLKEKHGSPRAVTRSIHEESRARRYHRPYPGPSIVANPTKRIFPRGTGNKAASSAPAAVPQGSRQHRQGVASAAAAAYQRKSYGIFSVFSLTKGGAAYLGLAKVVFVKVK